jgi:hypothetical protein
MCSMASVGRTRVLEKFALNNFASNSSVIDKVPHVGLLAAALSPPRSITCLPVGVRARPDINSTQPGRETEYTVQPEEQ